jgi:hypothetical protein
MGYRAKIRRETRVERRARACGGRLVPLGGMQGSHPYLKPTSDY